MAVIKPFPGNCGMRIVHGLSHNTTLEQQIEILSDALYGSNEEDPDGELMDFNVGQVIITDNLDNKERWKETKMVAGKGPISENPLHHSEIQVYIITEEILESLKHMFELLPKPKRAYKKKPVKVAKKRARKAYF